MFLGPYVWPGQGRQISVAILIAPSTVNLICLQGAFDGFAHTEHAMHHQQPGLSNSAVDEMSTLPAAGGGLPGGVVS